MKKQSILRVLCGLGFALPCISHAQQDSLELFYLQQASLAEGIVNELNASSVDRQLFSLRTANLMLSSRVTPSSFAFEEAVAAGALSALAELALDANPEVAELARNVRTRIIEELALDNRANRLVVLDGTAAETLDSGDYDGWLAFETQAGKEYRVRASGCDVIQAIALRADDQTPIAGGTAVGRSFAFTSPSSDRAEMHVRTSRCSGPSDVMISAGDPRREIPAMTSADSPFRVSTGNLYAGRIPAEESQWLSLASSPAQSIVLQVTPLTPDLDTYVAVIDAGGAELGYNDDNGVDRGSTVEFASPSSGDVLVEIGSYYGYSSGEYELSVVTLPAPLERSRRIALGEPYTGELSMGSSDWWRFDPEPGVRYSAETTVPENGLDSFLTLYESDGTTWLDDDDDRGIGLGSRVVFVSTSSAPLLMKVHSIGGIGPYGISVKPYQFEFDHEEDAVGEGRYTGVLREDGESWWRLDTPAGRYEVEVTPTDGVDTLIELYDSEGLVRLNSDDDGGVNFGSKLAFGTTTDDTRLLNISSITDVPGAFELLLTRLPSIAESAEQAEPGETYSAQVESNGESWWRLEVRTGRTYVIEARPADLFDSVLAIYSDEGETEVGFDDDSGSNGGSRLVYESPFDGVLFVRVTGFSGAAGAFELSVREQ